MSAWSAMSATKPSERPVHHRFAGARCSCATFATGESKLRTSPVPVQMHRRGIVVTSRRGRRRVLRRPGKGGIDPRHLHPGLAAHGDLGEGRSDHSPTGLAAEPRRCAPHVLAATGAVARSRTGGLDSGPPTNRPFALGAADCFANRLATMPHDAPTLTRCLPAPWQARIGASMTAVADNDAAARTLAMALAASHRVARAAAAPIGDGRRCRVRCGRACSTDIGCTAARRRVAARANR